MSGPITYNHSNSSLGKVFIKTDVARTGLNTGDVVALRVKGAFLGVVPIEYQESPVLYALAPLHDATIDENSVHLEVVRHGEWIGFKSSVANHSMLQAKKKGVQRLVFYSPRFGIYEQWTSLDICALDAIHWRSTVMNLQNRKVHTCEMRVEVHRVGFMRESGNEGNVTPLSHSLHDVESMKSISGIMVQEWIKFVEKEKERRSLLEARVDQAIENVDGLRQWALEQVQYARRDVQEEIELLIHALQDRNAALAEVSARLTMRIQWGAALLQAKKATILGRKVLLAWKSKAARSKYCDAAVLKIQRRRHVRSALIVLDEWLASVDKSKDLQRRLRQGVRKMSSMKMNCAFSKWRVYSHASHEQARIEAGIHHDALLIAQSQMAKKVFTGWRWRTNRSKEACRLLSFFEIRQNESLLSRLFGAWKNYTVETILAMKALHCRTALRQKMQLLSVSLHVWRLSVDDGLGERIEIEKLISMHVKKKKQRSFELWRYALANQKRSKEIADSMESCQFRDTKAQCVLHWRQHTLQAAKQRANLMNFVLSISQKTSMMTFRFWKEYASRKNLTRLHISKAKNRKNSLSLLDCLSWWRALSQEEKMHRKFVNICSQRREMKIAKATFTDWREKCQKSTRTYANLVNFTNAWSLKRMKMSFVILRRHASESMLEQSLHKKAVVWHRKNLCTRVIRALHVGAQSHHQFLNSLEKIRAEQNLGLKRSIWNAWTFQTDETVGRKALSYNFGIRKQWHSKNQCFIAWRDFVANEKFWDRSAHARKRKIDLKRKKWIFQTWRETTASSTMDNALNRKACMWHARKATLKAVSAWSQQKNLVSDVTLACGMKCIEKDRYLLSNALMSWKQTWLYNNHLRLSGQKVMFLYATRLQTLSLHAWRSKAETSRFYETQMSRALIKISQVRLKTAFQHWRQVAEDESGKTAYCAHLENLEARKKDRSILGKHFAGWESRCIQIKLHLNNIFDRQRSRLKVLKYMYFRSWRFNAERLALQRTQTLMVLARKQSIHKALESFVLWRHETIKQSRNAIITLHSVERMCLKLTKQSWIAWRMFASESKEHKTTMVRLLNSFFHKRMRCVLTSWRLHAAEESRRRKDLERCILQKKVALELFRQSYWDTVDDQMHETLEAMFADADDPKPVQTEQSEIKELSSKTLSQASWQEEESPSSYCGSLREISTSFEIKGKALKAAVSQVLKQNNQYAAHALTPPKHEISVLEPLQYFFHKNSIHGSVSGAESLCGSDFAASDEQETLKHETEILDIGDFSPLSMENDDLRVYSNSRSISKHCMLQKPLSLQSKPDGRWDSPPRSPLILARDRST